MIHRTGFFPGLGWLLPRALWENELRSKWPRSHWDHWLREETQHKGRECLYPQVLSCFWLLRLERSSPFTLSLSPSFLFVCLVSWEPISILETVFENKPNYPLFKIPRDFHNGIKGTFMTLDTHNKYFAGVAFNTNQSFRWNGFEIRSEMTFWIGLSILLIFLWFDIYFRDEYEAAIQTGYEERLHNILRNARHAASLADLESILQNSHDENVNVVVWYSGVKVCVVSCHGWSYDNGHFPIRRALASIRLPKRLVFGTSLFEVRCLYSSWNLVHSSFYLLSASHKGLLEFDFGRFRIFLVNSAEVSSYSHGWEPFFILSRTSSSFAVVSVILVHIQAYIHAAGITTDICNRF